MKLMIVEDEALIAEDIADLCEDIGLPPVFVAYRAGQAIDYLSNNPVDLVLLDINLGDSIDGVEIAEYINANCSADFIFLTSYSDQHTLARVAKTNPAGFIVKPFNKEQLQSTLRLVSGRKKEPIHDLSLEIVNKYCHVSLSEREYEMVSLLYKGKTNGEIAAACFLSVNTVKYHLKQVFLQLSVKSRIELINLLHKVKEG